MEDFASYILNEEDYVQKMIITYYLSRKTGIYFDKSVVLKTEITKLFIDYSMIDVDKNLIYTAMLLCNCRKIEDAQKRGKLETYAKEGAEYLRSLGFSKRFCKICEEINRYSGSEPRERESDILEVVDQFTGLILNRVERPAFSIEEAITILRERNFKDVHNRYLDEFIAFVNEMGKICIRETIDVPIIKKLINLHNMEANVKTFISAIGEEYGDRIESLVKAEIERQAKQKLEVVQAKRYTKIREKTNRALFSKEIADRILNHESKYKVEE